MTKRQVSTYYGEPFHRVGSGQGEMWFYRLKFDEVYGRAWVPFQFDSYNIYPGTITFDAAGKVKSFDWNRAKALSPWIE